MVQRLLADQFDPEQPLIPFDPVEMLVKDIGLEISMETNNNSGGFQFWAQTNGHLFDTSIGSFSESVTSIKTYLSGSKDAYDYAVRLMIRLNSKVYAKEAIDTIGKSFIDLSQSLGIQEISGVDYTTLDPFSKLLMFIAINKPQLSLLVLAGPLGRGE